MSELLSATSAASPSRLRTAVTWTDVPRPKRNSTFTSNARARASCDSELVVFGRVFADREETMRWERFVAYGLFVVVSFIWVQSRRSSGRTVTIIGVIGFFAVFWFGLKFAGWQ
jgi:hypothetical protein